MSFKNWSLPKTLPFILIIVGLVGVYCSFVLSQDKIHLLENPAFVPGCNLDPILSCGSVIITKQATAFGFPNPFIGLAAFPVLATVGLAMLAGARLKRWFWLSLEAAMLAGLAFAYWLLFQSIYRIHALCPYCLVVDVVIITGAWYVTLYNIDKKHIKLPAGKPQKVYDWIRRRHLDILILWFLIIIGLILKHFWYYYGKHLF